MSQDTVLALLRAFGPMSAADLSQAGKGAGNRQTVGHALGRLKEQGEVWHMGGYARQGGRIGIWGVV